MPPQPRPPRSHWVRLIIAIYGPTLVASIGFGAVVPLIAVQATVLHASVGVAAAITALPGLAMLLFDLPAGVIAARLGEKLSIILACLVDAAMLLAVFWATSLPVLATAVFIHGMTGSIFGLARQTYATEAIPLRWRARGMSSLGGVFRIGGFLGPLAASAILSRGEVAHAFAFGALTSLLAALVTLVLPDLPTDRRAQRDADGNRAHTRSVLHRHRRSLLTLGLGCLGLMMMRSSRQTLVPLWAHQAGFSPADVSLLYALSMAFDVVLFLPGGAIMDRFGRWWVCVPTMFALAICMLVLPFTTTYLQVGIVAVLLGIGNGVSSGIVLTLGADASPGFGRAQFLAGWRLLADGGTLAGPAIIAGVAALTGLAVSSWVIGGLGLLGGYWLARWVSRNPEQLAAIRPAE